MSALSFKINAETDKLNSFINSLERLKKIISDLPSGTKEFDVINAKIAELEKRAEQSVKRIAEMQKVGIAASSPAASDSASVAKETSSYQELIESLNDVLGSRGQNIAAMVRERDAIRVLQKELARISEIETKGLNLSDAQKARRILVVNSIEQHKQALSSLRQVVSNDIKLEQAAATSMDEMSQSLSKMRIAYRQMTEEERNSKFGQELLKNIQKADTQIKKLDESIGNHQRSVGNYAKQWNGLQNQMQIVARELPNFAISPQIGIMSLSNNIPYLVDELQKAKVAYKEYILAVRAGQTDLQKVSPVWKQMLSSLFSWQTAVVAAITLLTAYRKEIGEWVSGLFRAKNATKDLLSAEQELALARKKSVSDYVKETTRLDLLYKTARNASKSVRERNIAVSELQKLYPDYLSNLKNEDYFTGKAEKSYKKLRDEIIANALVRGQLNKMEELGSQRFDLWVKERNAYVSYLRSKAALERNDSDLQKTITANSKKQWDDAKKDLQNMDETISGMANNIDVSKLFQQPKEGTYDYWQQQVERAQSALKQIKSEVKKTLDEARKQGKDLYSLGIDKNIVDTYKSAMSQLSNANKNISIYDNLNKGYGSKEEKEADKLRKLQEKNNEEILSLRRKNQKDEANLMEEGTEKKLARISADYDAQAQEIEKKAKEFAERNKEASIKGVNSNGLTIEQQKDIDKANKLNADNRIKQENEVYRSEILYMQDYLKEYGTFQQQKLAIAQEYNEKVAKSTNEWQKKSLEKQKNAALLKVDVQAAKQNIDWQSVLGDFGSIIQEQVQPTIDNLKKIVQSDEFKDSSVESQQRIYDVFNQLEKQSATLGKNMFKDVATDLQVFRNSLNAYNAAQEREITASEALVKAQKELKTAQSKGGDVSAAKRAVGEAQDAFNQASESVKAFSVKVNENANNLNESSIKARGALEGIANGLSRLKSDSLEQAFEGFKDIGKGIGGKLGDAVSKIDPTGIISAALGIVDMLKDGLSSVFVDLQDMLYGAIEGMLNDVFSGDILVKPIKNAVSHIGNILNTVTFGGFSSWTSSSNAKEVAETTERLTSSNEILKQSIDALKEEIGKARGADTVKVYDETVEKQKELIENTGDILAAQMGYHGAHHSNDYYINKELSDDDWRRISGKTGKNVSGMSDLWNLSPEDLRKVSTLTDIWDKIYNGGKYDKSDYIDQYLELADTIGDLETQLQETLTQTTFDDVYDNFIDTLMDMNKSAEDFADDLSKVFMKAVLSNQIGQEYAAELEEWYKKFADAMKNGTIDDVRGNLADEYMGYVNDAIKERDELAKTIGYDSNSSSSSQQSTSKGFQTMSQDTGEELNGRFTALQIAGEETKNQLTIQTQEIVKQAESMSAMMMSMQSQERTGGDMLQMMANIYLETVGINENTGLSAKYLKDIKSDIAEVKKNTSRL